MRPPLDEDLGAMPDGIVVNGDRLALPRDLAMPVLLFVGGIVLLIVIIETVATQEWFSVWRTVGAVIFGVMGLWAITHAITHVGRRTLIVEKDQIVVETRPFARGRIEVSRVGLQQIVVAVLRPAHDPFAQLGWAVFAYARGSDTLLVELDTEEQAAFVEAWLERGLKLGDDGQRATYIVGS